MVGPTVPEQCVECVKRDECTRRGCLKEKPCKQRQQADPVDEDLLAEIKERMR